jgi:hypothetical protein
MTAPAIDAPAVDIPEGAAPVRLPVMVVEGMWTSDGRFIEPGALALGVMPISLYSQIRSSHGSLDGDTATVLTGAITDAVRRPGPEVTQLSTGEPFPEGTFVWEGTGWMYQDVPAPPEKSAYQLVKDKALRGNSVDLAQVDAEFHYDEDQDLASDPHPRRISVTQGVIGATTLVGQPAFPDAYIELDGTAMELAPEPEDEVQEYRDGAGNLIRRDVITASAVPAWRSTEVGDLCSPCIASAGPHDAEIQALTDQALAEDDGFAQLLQGAEVEPEDITPVHTGGMLALVPENPNMLRVPDGDPPEELHLTLAYLGDNVTDWQPEDVAAVQRIALEATDWQALVDRVRAEEIAEGTEEPGMNPMRMPGQEGPLEGSIFSHAIFNPNGDNGHDPATVYMLDGTGDRAGIEFLAGELCHRVEEAIGTTRFPDQHRPFIPHVTAGYGVPIENLTYTGPVTFDRLRVALGDNVTDYRLGGGAVTASAAPLPPASWFANPRLIEPTAPVVGDMTPAGAPVYGHLACWGTCHIGFGGKCITPPRSASSYAYFMVHAARAELDEGGYADIPVGYGTIGTGHASIRHDAIDAAAHYDNTGTVAFEYAVGEDEHGIWFAGRMLPGLGEAMERKARGTVFSGDWRTIRGRLELVASLGVNVPGFPIPRVRVASGAPLTLIAAGVPQRTAAFIDNGGALASFGPDVAELLDYVRGQRVQHALAQVASHTEGAAEQHAADAFAVLTLATEHDHPWFTIPLDDAEEDDEPGEGDDYAKRKNWVAKAGGLPKFIKRIAKHIQRESGYDESRAIASAVNAAKKMCATGDTNLPGAQQVNAGSRAEACAAVAEWEAKRAKS